MQGFLRFGCAAAVAAAATWSQYRSGGGNARSVEIPRRRPEGEAPCRRRDIDTGMARRQADPPAGLGAPQVNPGGALTGASAIVTVRRYFWMQVSTVSLVHSSRPVNTGSSTFSPLISFIITPGAR